MKRRITQVTTRAGDRGQSSLADGSTLDKTHPRFDAIGTVDELNSHLGVLLANLPAAHERHQQFLQNVQQSLFDLGGALAIPGSDKFPTTEQLEQIVRELNAELPPLTEFVLPGGTNAAALAHVCRTVCRRAERSVWQLEADCEAGGQFLNRLSDYFFVLARSLNDSGTELQWRGSNAPQS